MKRGVFLCVLVGTGLLQAGTCTWNPAGTGGWADTTRWLAGTVPSAGDTVDFNGCTGVVTKADAETLAKVGAITLTGSGSGLVLSNEADDGDFEFGKPVTGDGVLIKRGSGVTRMTYAETTVKTGYWMQGGLEVLDGTLVLPRSPSKDLYLAKLTVMEPGVFVHTGNVYTRVVGGLWGTGTVSNDVSKPMYVSGGPQECPAVFEGRFVRSAYPCLQSNGEVTNKVQYFTGTQSSNQKDFLLYSHDGTAGIAKFGADKGDKGSVGSATMTLWYRGLRNRVLYLGDGETVWKTIGLGDGARDVTLDAGAHGGLTVVNPIRAAADVCNYMNAFTFSGGGENVYDADYTTVTNPAGRNVAHYITKDGPGSWRFTAGKTRTMMGTVEVKKGCLKFDSIAERGTDCSLGTANLTQSKYTGGPSAKAIDDSKTVPYAFVLGNGEDSAEDEHLATLEYTGDENAHVQTRDIVVKGAGRLKTSAASLVWTGVTAADSGQQTLVLDSSDAPLAVTATNGVGTVGIVKEGLGECVLQPGCAISGDLRIKAGSLRVSGGQYGWYRLTVTETWNYATNSTGATLGGNGGPLTMRQFALMDDRGENQILGLSHNKSADGKPWLLQPGEAAIGCQDYRILGTDDLGRNVTWALSNLFTTAAKDFGAIRRPIGATYDLPYRGFNTEPARQISVVLRLPALAKPVTHYDIRCQGYWPDNSSAGQRMPRAWTLEGSSDGVGWDLLTTVTTNDNTYANIPTGGAGRWYSNNSTTQGTGYGPFAAESAKVSYIHPSSVEVSAGASLMVSGGSVQANGISYDCTAEGAGTLSGVSFASDAVIRLTGLQKDQFGTLLPLTLENCAGVSDRLWDVVVDGVPSPNCYARVSTEGIRVLRRGFSIIFR